MNLLLVLLLLVASALPADAAPATKKKQRPSSTVADAVRAVIVDDSIDLATAKLKFDRMVDPKVQSKKVLMQLRTMQRAIEKLAGPAPTDAQKLSALRRYIYDSGEWNGNKPFAYDLTDPYGLKTRNRFLTTYLATRQGNCISMPVLFVILGERVGLKMTLALAPQHMLVKYTDAASGKTINLEATSGGWPSRDVWYRQNLSMSDDAIRNGLYMRPLTKREVRAVLASVVMDDLMERKQLAEAAQVANALLENYPNFLYALLTQANASILQVEAEIYAKYPNPKDMPPQVRQQYQSIIDAMSGPYRKVEALGWRETDGQPMPQRKTTPN